MDFSKATLTTNTQTKTLRHTHLDKKTFSITEFKQQLSRGKSRGTFLLNGPSLFRYYINDLPAGFISSVLLFVDDTVFYLVMQMLKSYRETFVF